MPDENTIIQRRRKGQTLAEFAITLPILLILVFGVIEFGRIFQAWVTLQNAARAAARYATTGAYDLERYVINDSGEDDPTGAVPCVNDADLRGSPSVDEWGVTVFDGTEGLFATWYDGTDCKPNIPQHQDMRKDILRILSIWEQARIGASGLALGGENLIADVTGPEGIKRALYDVWHRPLNGGTARAGSDQPGWFDVMICSSRIAMNPLTATYWDPDIEARFVTSLDKENPVTGDPRAPACILNEIPPDTAPHGGTVDNSDHPWLDAGGAGDTVTIVVTFNHPLVTPLGLAPYVQIQARRSAVNEAFRVADATRALLPSGRPGITLPQPPTAIIEPITSPIILPAGETEYQVTLDGTRSTDPEGGPLTYSWRIGGIQMPGGTTAVFRPTLPPGDYEIVLVVVDNQGLQDDAVVRFSIRPAATATDVPPTNTPVPTDTPIPPFQCELLTVSNLNFFGNRVFIEIQNNNAQSSTLTRAVLGWRTLADYPNMAVTSFALNGAIHWNGRDQNPNTDTNADRPTPDDIFLTADRTVPGDGSQSGWEAVFAAGPAMLSNEMTIYDFAGTEFWFENPLDLANPCRRPLDIPTPTPSPTFWAGRPTNTATWTPDCASVLVDVRFVEFRTFGVVVLNVTNRRSNVAVFTDFQINWIQRAAGQMTLERITVGGTGPADSITPTTVVWQSGSPTQDSTPPTNGGSTLTPREGTWLQNYSFPPNSATRMYLDFGGTTTTLPAAFGVSPSDFNGTWFQIGCGVTGGSGSGSGSGSSGRINLFNENTPVPTNTRGPTQPPPPTFTPSRTFTPGPPTRTPLPPTPTNTPGPTNTQPPSPTRTPPPLPTEPGTGGSDGDN